jgi:hypothetical protein
MNLKTLRRCARMFALAGGIGLTATFSAASVMDKTLAVKKASWDYVRISCNERPGKYDGASSLTLGPSEVWRESSFTIVREKSSGARIRAKNGTCAVKGWNYLWR